MRFSRALKSSAHSLPSPNGAFVATLLPGKLMIRATRSLEVVRAINLPADISAVQSFTWSSSSTRLLVSSADVIRVWAVDDARFAAVVSHPTSGTTKATSIAFGATHDEILVFAEFGLKLTVFNLVSSTATDIPSPKFYTPATATRGYSIRAGRKQWALLTRNQGKDIVSVHPAGSVAVIRSWVADSVDAQSLAYSPDGRWLAVAESAGQGHKILFYTADGDLYKMWRGPAVVSVRDSDPSVGAGVRTLEWSSSGTIAVGDFNTNISVLSVPGFSEVMKLCPASTIRPLEGLQVWQEQFSPTVAGFERQYVSVTQPICPPTSVTATTPSTPAKDAASTVAGSGTTHLSFDASGTLLASRVDNMPTTLWLWDVRSRRATAVIMTHAPILRAAWHPRVPELLMIRCGDREAGLSSDINRGIIHLWEPSWENPRIVDFARQLAGGRVIGKTVAAWLGVDATDEAPELQPLPTLFFSDTQDYLFGAITDTDSPDADGTAGGHVPWQESLASGIDIYGQRAGSPHVLVGPDDSAAAGQQARIQQLVAEGEMLAAGRMSGSDEVDDTFQFRKFVA